MIIDAPRKSQIPALRSLWQDAFDDTQDFLDDFYRTAFHVNRCRCVVEDGNMAAALYWFDCMHMGRSIAYVYAVATARAYRRQGICHELIESMHVHLAGLGYEGVILVPGSKELFRFYEGMGYQICSMIREFSCTAAVKGEEEVLLRSISRTEYAQLRRQLLPEGGVVQENENMDFLQTQAQFYAGLGFLLTARKEEDKLVGVELLGDETKAPEIVRAFGCVQGIFRVPGEGRPFAMFRPLTESVHPAPAYFGLAFD